MFKRLFFFSLLRATPVRLGAPGHSIFSMAEPVGNARKLRKPESTVPSVDAIEMLFSNGSRWTTLDYQNDKPESTVPSGNAIEL